MPKGRRGCFACSEPTALIMQVWLREVDEIKDGEPNRKQRSVASISRSFCAEHGVEIYGSLAVLLARQNWYGRRCDRCEAPYSHRLQVWLRRRVDRKTIESLAIPLCEACAYELYAQTIEPLDGEWHCSAHPVPPQNLQVARRARAKAR